MNIRRSLVMLAVSGLVVSAPAQADAPTNEAEIHDFAEDVLEAVEEAAAAEARAQEEAERRAQEKAEKKASLIGQGLASYYGYELAGNRTASGERFDPEALTAAHRTLPLGTRVRVVNETNGRSVVVRVNDRGPFIDGRIIDVSYGAAQEIGMVRSGKAKVRLERLGS